MKEDFINAMNIKPIHDTVESKIESYYRKIIEMKLPVVIEASRVLFRLDLEKYIELFNDGKITVTFESDKKKVGTVITRIDGFSEMVIEYHKKEDPNDNVTEMNPYTLMTYHTGIFYPELHLAHGVNCISCIKENIKYLLYDLYHDKCKEEI